MARWPWRKKAPVVYGGHLINRRAREILTAEGLRLPLTIATRGARAGAVLIDLFLVYFSLALITALFIWIIHGIGIDKFNPKNPAQVIFQALVIVWIIFVFLARNIWFLWFELGPRGATPGKRMTGIRIAARPGRDGAATRLSAEAVIARNLLRDVELFMPVIFIGSALRAGTDTTLAGWASLVWFAIFALFPFFNRDALRCGDIIAGTWVVEAPRAKLDAALSLGDAGQGLSSVTGAQYRFGDADLAIYGEYELQVLERVLRDNRPQVLAEVAETICGKIGWTTGTGDERAFLEAYYTQLRARLESGMRFGQRKADKFADR
ncbi:RDD family protein [Novosphingobium sp.]|uniref:RDD family protein n=1 Tax=Novosphingobium sp. TaxID=1874826 RepID=UPI003D0A5CCD